MNESPADDFFDVLSPPRRGRRIRGMITLFFYCVFIPTCFSLQNINLTVVTEWFYYEIKQVSDSLVLGDYIALIFTAGRKENDGDKTQVFDLKILFTTEQNMFKVQSYNDITQTS